MCQVRVVLCWHCKPLLHNHERTLTSDVCHCRNGEFVGTAYTSEQHDLSSKQCTCSSAKSPRVSRVHDCATFDPEIEGPSIRGMADEDEDEQGVTVQCSLHPHTAHAEAMVVEGDIVTCSIHP